ncbi:hypothetical protein ACAG24_024150 [Mycobacterium sp. pW049]|uniref:hypothetical protein n=1 Tax=[Mycobacterium] bulgaricum TaxID=3238985 RepID=UPI00351B1B0F
MLPADASPITSRRIQDFDAPTLDWDDKQLVLTLCRLYFGPARAAVQDVSSADSLRELGRIFRAPGERFELLETSTSLGTEFFSRPVQRASGLHGAKLEQFGNPSKFFLYCGPLNATMYIGADYLHGSADAVTVNCILLNSSFDPVESHTLRV